MIASISFSIAVNLPAVLPNATVIVSLSVIVASVGVMSPIGSVVGSKGIASFETGTTAGTLSGLRRNDQIRLDFYNNITVIRDFRVDSIGSDCRYFIGWSRLYGASAPGNTNPSNLTELIAIAKNIISLINQTLKVKNNENK